MLWAIFFILLILWALGSICHIAFSYLLLVIAVIVLVSGCSGVEGGERWMFSWQQPAFFYLPQSSPDLLTNFASL